MSPNTKIAVDASVVIPWLNGVDHPEVAALKLALERNDAALPPVILTEVLSDPAQGAAIAEALDGFAILSLEDGFWRRAGQLRAKLLAAGRKAKLADTLVAQTCIDADVPLLTRDRDFEAFVKLGGLKLHKK